ncbi:hypothetical protein Droror1_Dr00021814 [Drosera rotundifolia]
MASRFTYKRLKQEPTFDDHDQDEGWFSYAHVESQLDEGSKGYKISRKWCRINTRMRPRRVKVRVRVRVSGLKRFLRVKGRIVRAAWCKVVRRLRESQAHFGEIFAGNYLFLQVNPPSNKRLGGGFGDGTNGVLGFNQGFGAAGFSGLRLEVM